MVADKLAASAEAPLASADLAELVRTIEPQKARNGSLRFSDAQLDTPAAAKLLLERLSSGRDSEAVRSALVIALPRTQGDYASGLLPLLKTEKSDALRADLVDAMRLAKDSASALEGLKLGLADSSESVRTRAAYNLGRRADGLALVDDLLAALRDSEASVQSASARALGQLGSTKGFDEVAGLLASRSADVRLESLRALGRMDAERASQLTQLTELAADSDERVRTAAAKVQTQAY
jgi:HEAT repeat protein